MIERNADLAVAGINLQTARLRAGLARDQQGPRVNSNVQLDIALISTRAMMLPKVYHSVLA